MSSLSLCRLCITPKPELTFIHQEGKELADLLFRVTKIKFKKADKQAKVCLECHNDLSQIIELRDKWLNSNKLFETLLAEEKAMKTKSSKIEPNENEDEFFPRLTKRDLKESKAYRGLCHLCGLHFQHLWVHMRRSHDDSVSFFCFCGAAFKSKQNLSLHALLHEEPKFECYQCEAKYRTKERLKRHFRVHTDYKNRPFSCHVVPCEKRFYTKYNLDVHLRMHSGEKLFKCKECTKSFAHPFSLKPHYLKHHAEEQQQP